ncbi:MAG: CHAT domain-containing protein [Alphaproteobacteria bacterium]
MAAFSPPRYVAFLFQGRHQLSRIARLSACNTAAGDAESAQALSGLARAFIYAQARALLVSHWAVNSDATVKLITGAMREMARDAKVGRAEALRRAMLSLIQADGHTWHPSYWAPFVLVGEGAGR